MKKWPVAGGLLTVLALAIWVRVGPIPDIKHETTPTIVVRNGIVLYEPLSRGGTRSMWIDAIPDNIAKATLAAEDHRFYHHVGIDPTGIARAALHNLQRTHIVEGGSTITQQVAKMMFSPSTRTLRAKVRESIAALRLEHRHTKAEILNLYLNLAPYGQQTVGIERASDRYFGCQPDQLTIAQAAYLAALPQRPGKPRLAMQRQRVILTRMRDLYMISDADYRTARAERLAFDRGRHPAIAQHYVENLLRHTASGERQTIRTTLDANLQREVRGIIAAHKADLLRHGAHSAAVAVFDNRTGEWLAWEGSGDYFGENFGGAIDGVTTLRQPGSTLKPFTYALAFEQGFTPATVIADVPSHFPTAEAGVLYSPRNYDGRFRGPLRARAALAGSENVPAVAVLSKIGPESLLRFLRRAGFRDLNHTVDYYGVGLTLGDAEVTLQQLIKAYAIFARGGDGVISPRTAFWITDILSDAHAREYIFGSGGNLDFPFPVAVKTGTSQAYHDNWTVGYTREITVGVWVGNFDRNALRNSSGITGAAPIFHDVMLAAVKRVGGGGGPIVDRPSDLELQPICALSGHRPSTECPAIESEWLPASGPVEFCSWHHGDRLVLPAEYRAWEPVSLSPFAVSRSASLHVLNPPNGATYWIDPTLRSEFQALQLKATSPVTWIVDGRRTNDAWSLSGGKHTITAVDREGRRDSVTITVR
ncbi:MAG: penicillin-binding protein 1C [Acidobacteriota bacterium]|nr:penicillin-binding protein 1C [Acidobacteriota bacterium]